MLDTLKSATYRDFSQRYRGTFGWLVSKDKDVPVLIREVSDTVVTFQGLNGEEYFAYADKDVMFKFLPLKRRITLGSDGNLYAISRHPARQYRRGVCADNTHVNQLTAGGPINRIVDVSTINTIILGEAAKPAPGTVKLSDQFAIVGTMLYLYEYMIGTVVSNSDIMVDKKYLSFVQELRDAIRNGSFKYRILND